MMQEHQVACLLSTGLGDFALRFFAPSDRRECCFYVKSDVSDSLFVKE